MRFEHVKVLPFVGENYKKETPWGLPIMVLGESHYYSRPLPAGITIEVVEAMLDDPWKPWMKLFARAEGVFQNGRSNRESRRKFWSSAVYYNFIQETVGDGPGIRPTDEMWRNAAPALKEVLVQYAPGFVLVLGTEMWAKLPVPLKPGPLVTLPDGQSRESRLYSNGAGDAFTFGIAHPSSHGWSYQEWTPWVQAALRAAVEFQRA